LARTSLRDYQRDLAERLRNADRGVAASKLGVQAGTASWLVDLADAGEVIPVPPITPVPLTRPWFRGMANIRGNLYSVVDFPAFLGGKPVPASNEARLLLIGERFRTGVALLVDRSLGLLGASQLQPRAAAGAERAPWVKGEHTDAGGREWIELDVPQLIQHPDFLGVAT
jgi:twitching motility protein PilI